MFAGPKKSHFLATRLLTGSRARQQLRRHLLRWPSIFVAPFSSCESELRNETCGVRLLLDGSSSRLAWVRAASKARCKQCYQRTSIACVKSVLITYNFCSRVEAIPRIIKSALIKIKKQQTMTADLNCAEFKLLSKKPRANKLFRSFVSQRRENCQNSLAEQ